MTNDLIMSVALHLYDEIVEQEMFGEYANCVIPHSIKDRFDFNSRDNESMEEHIIPYMSTSKTSKDDQQDMLA